MKIDLSNKIALVTGASGDLGRVMVQTLSQCGADVAIQYLNNRDKAEQLATQCQQLNVQAIAVQCDITEPDSVAQMKIQVCKKLGDPNIIVTNAVIQYEPRSPVLDQPLTDYESQFRSCVIQNVLMAKAFVPAMIQNNWGRVIAINTECSMLYNELDSAYVSGKRGMDGMLRVLAKEVGPHQVTVNQVAPGYMISNRDRVTGSEHIESYEKNVPLKRRGHDQDIANSVAFLASDLANFITGVFLPVCGGHIMPAI